MKVEDTSRSSIVDREECDRLRLLGWELDRTVPGQAGGYQPRASSVAILSGIHIHNGASHLLTTGRLDEAVEVMLAGYADEFDRVGVRQGEGEDVARIRREQMWMLEMLLRGWHRVRYPQVLADYAVVSTEQEWDWELGPGLRLSLRFDAVLRRHDDGLLHVLDFKGTSSGDGMWEATHEKSRQTILYLTALEERSGESVGGMLYEGLVRGSFRRDTAKSSPFAGQRIQHTPLVYGYRLADPFTGMNMWRPNYTAAKGWVKTPAWEDHTIIEWLDFLDQEGVLRELFIAGSPVNPPPALRQSLRRQIAHEERAWFDGLAEFERLRPLGDEDPRVVAHLEAWAPQKTGRCGKYGEDHRCPFAAQDVCFLSNALEVVASDPAFQPRIPHHTPSEVSTP